MVKVEVVEGAVPNVKGRRGKKNNTGKSTGEIVIRASVKRDVWNRFLSVITHDKPVQSWVGDVIERFVMEEEKKRTG